jgi:hypothetical protein
MQVWGRPKKDECMPALEVSTEVEGCRVLVDTAIDQKKSDATYTGSVGHQETRRSRRHPEDVSMDIIETLPNTGMRSFVVIATALSQFSEVEGSSRW